jgi:hypothetical protein
MGQEPPDHTPSPPRRARARHFARGREAPPPRTQAQTIASNPGQPLAHHARCVRAHLSARLAAPHRLGDGAVTLGRPAEPMPHTGARGMSCPATMAFDHLGPRLLGPHPWPLAPQSIFRAAAQLPVSDPHCETQALACIH